MKSFDLMAWSLAILAACSVAVTGKTFGTWRWLAAKWAAFRAEVTLLVGWVFQPEVSEDLAAYEQGYRQALDDTRTALGYGPGAGAFSPSFIADLVRERVLLAEAEARRKRKPAR